MSLCVSHCCTAHNIYLFINQCKLIGFYRDGLSAGRSFDSLTVNFIHRSARVFNLARVRNVLPLRVTLSLARHHQQQPSVCFEFCYICWHGKAASRHSEPFISSEMSVSYTSAWAPPHDRRCNCGRSAAKMEAYTHRLHMRSIYECSQYKQASNRSFPASKMTNRIRLRRFPNRDLWCYIKKARDLFSVTRDISCGFKETEK